MTTYRTYSPNTALPVELLDTTTAFNARKTYAGHHDIGVVDCVAINTRGTPADVVATGRQFGQNIRNTEARRISSLLRGWRG